jgi:uncharacterized protein YuzE
MSKENRKDPVADRLDVVIRLLLEEQRDRHEDITIGDQILILEDAGLKPSEAGKILGIESTQLTKYVTAAKNKKLKDKLSKKRKGS